MPNFNPHTRGYTPVAPQNALSRSNNSTGSRINSHDPLPSHDLESHPIQVEEDESPRDHHPLNCLAPIAQLWNACVQTVIRWGNDSVAQPTLADVVASTELIPLNMQHKLEDLKLLLRTPHLKTSHPNNLISLHVSNKADTKNQQLAQTEFFVDLDDIDHLPKALEEKLEKEAIYNGIHLMVPNTALPCKGLQGNKELIKSWLGLADEKVDFNLYPKSKAR